MDKQKRKQENHTLSFLAFLLPAQHVEPDVLMTTAVGGGGWMRSRVRGLTDDHFIMTASGLKAAFYMSEGGGEEEGREAQIRVGGRGKQQ